MANVRDSDTSLWLHNKLGTSNDSWISGSICSQLNKEVLRNIKECFPDLQTQVKLKLLLSFFHIPRRLVEEWKSELEEVIEVAGLDSELWVSMLAETMKTFPATSSLNTEISDYEETRPIFTDMVNDLRKMVSKHSDLGMLPLECQYLNKNALVSVVGQQPNPVKHFTLKRKPKSANLRTELLHKSADAQTNLKKTSAPTIPLRSRGMPRKMTDTTPLKGIPSRVPTSGFRSPNVQPNQSRPNMSRTPAGRKDGGIKLIEFTEQPLGYAAAKKRKRQQELEEQQKKALEQKQANSSTTNTTSASASSTSTTVTPAAATTLAADATSSTETTTTTTSSIATITSAATPDYAPTLTYTQPPTPAIETMCDDKLITAKQIADAGTIPSSSLPTSVQTNSNKIFIKEEVVQIKTEDAISRPIKIEQPEPLQQITMQQPQKQAIVTTSSNQTQLPLTQPIKMEKLDIKPIVKTTTTVPSLVQRANPLANLPNNISVKITSTKSTRTTQLPQQQQPIVINSSTPVILSPPLQNKQPSLSNASQQTQTQTLKSLPLSQLKSAANSGPVIISQTIIQPAKRANHSAQSSVVSSAPAITSNISSVVQTSAGGSSGSSSGTNLTSNLQQQQQQGTQYIITSSPQTTMPSLASFTQTRPTQQTIYQTSSASTASGSTQTPTKILLKTAPSLPVMMSTRQNQTNVQSNPPPLISTQQPTILNIQNVNLPNRPVTIQPASQAAQQQHLLQQQQHQQQQHIQQQQIQTHTVVSNTNATQQPKLTQVVMQSPSNSNVKGKTIILTQKGVILRNIGGDMYQQIPISNMSGLQNLGGATIVTTGPPGLVKSSQNAQTIHVQQPMKQNTQQMPALIPTNNLNQNIGVSSLAPVVVQQQPHQQTVQTIIGSPPQQTIIRPVMAQGSLPTLPQGLTLIQRPGQPTQLVQMQSTQQQQLQPQQQQQPTQIHRTILTQQPQTTTTNQLRPQQIILHHKPQQRIITTTTTQQALAQNNANNSNNSRGTQIIEVRQQPHQQQQHAQQQQQQQPQRKGLSLSNEHVHKAHEMFRKANRVSRPDKALILGFMAGLRENPRPNSENVIVIKLGETEEKVQQEDGTSALCLVESLIRLDYNTGEWKTFQNYRRLDQNSSAQNTDGGMQSQNSVVI